jgi:1-deoxy-D-xylulose-5-phosphate reductoisomerase
VAKRVAILGSTGSIGCNALDVIRHLGADYRAIALSARNQTDKLIEQAIAHRPAAVAVGEATHESDIARLKELGIDVYRGPGGILDIIRRNDVDMVLSAIVGAAGLPAAFATIEAGKPLALANKESLVVAGASLIPEARRRNVPILPVDSEHSAVFQAMCCGKSSEVSRVILTASGGPFRTAPPEQIERATLQDALNHPTWRMGSKITIDSATMFNKGLEIIEACWLFDLSPEQVQVIIHPESIVHSMVEFVDGSTIAQLSPPDMRTPIQYALTYPDRLAGCAPRLDLSRALSLNFQPPDFDRFPALRLAYQVARMRGTAGAILNAANEVAVAAFMAGTIPFGMISRTVEHTIRLHRLEPSPSLDDLLEADRWARRQAEVVISSSD